MPGASPKALKRAYIQWGYLRLNKDYRHLFDLWFDATEAKDDESAHDLAQRIQEQWLLKFPEDYSQEKIDPSSFLEPVVLMESVSSEDLNMSRSKVLRKTLQRIHEKSLARSIQGTFEEKRFLLLCVDMATVTSTPKTLWDATIAPEIQKYRKSSRLSKSKPGIGLAKHKTIWEALRLRDQKKLSPTEISKALKLTKDPRQHNKAARQLLNLGDKYVKLSPFLPINI